MMDAQEASDVFDRAMATISQTVNAVPAKNDPESIAIKTALLHSVSAIGALGMTLISIGRSFERIAEAQEKIAASVPPFLVIETGDGSPLVRPDSGSATVHPFPGKPPHP